jgi:SMI1/KNR4 family protein SUKH-1
MRAFCWRSACETITVEPTRAWALTDDYNPQTGEGTTQLVRSDAYTGIHHTGGVAQYQEATGTKSTFEKLVIMPELAHTEEQLTDEDFTNFERLFRTEIPLSFKSHYMADNGGFPSEEDVEAGKWGLPVHGFNPIKYGNLTIERVIESMESIDPQNEKFGSWAKFSYVPFAYDEGGNTIFLSLRDTDYGSVYIYAFDGNNIKRISPSFEEFRARLYQPSSR